MKSQAAMEFMSLVMVVLFIVFITYVVVMQKQFGTQTRERFSQFDTLCGDVADKINKAFYFGHGFAQKVFLPENFYGRTYNISVQDNRLNCKVEDDLVVKRLITSSVSQIEIPHEEIEIKNIASFVVIS